MENRDQLRRDLVSAIEGGLNPLAGGQLGRPLDEQIARCRAAQGSEDAEFKALFTDYEGELVAIPVGLVATACYLIRKHEPDGKLLGKLRAYTTGDKYKPVAPVVGAALGPHYDPAAADKIDPVVEKVREALLARSQLGIKKYGDTLHNKNYAERELLQHAIEESMDLSNYLMALIMKLDTVPKPG